MTIARRLMILLAAPLLILLALGAFTKFRLAVIEERTGFAAVTQIRSLATLGTITRSFTEMRVNLRSYLLATDPTAQANARDAFEKDQADLTASLQHYADHLVTGDKDRRLLLEY